VGTFSPLALFECRTVTPERCLAIDAPHQSGGRLRCSWVVALACAPDGCLASAWLQPAWAKRHITDDAAGYKLLLDLLAEYGDTEDT
jgi:hypothetical protein